CRSSLARRRTHFPAIRRRLRLRGRRSARSMPQGSDLAVHAVRLPGPAQARLAHGAEVRTELAAGAAARAGRARTAAAGARRAIRGTAAVLPRVAVALADDAGRAVVSAG